MASASAFCFPFGPMHLAYNSASLKVCSGLTLANMPISPNWLVWPVGRKEKPVGDQQVLRLYKEKWTKGKVETWIQTFFFPTGSFEVHSRFTGNFGGDQDLIPP